MMVVFDIGSTLIDGARYGPARRLGEMLDLKDPAAIERLEHILFRTPAETPSDLARRISAALHLDASEACTRLWDAQLDEAYVLPGAREAVGRLRSAGVPRAYLSNIWPPFYECFRREFAEEAGQPQFLSFQTGLMKPDPAFFRSALERLGAHPADVVMVGDTYSNDILPAIELGMRTVWVLHRPEKERAALVEVLNGRAPKPTLTLSSIAALRLEDLR